jgi:hypothetical protein
MMENEMGRACGTNGREEKSVKVWWESPKERDVLEDRGVDGKMGSKWRLTRRA